MPAVALESKLTVKQKLFVEFYLQVRNGFQAAKMAGYAGDDGTLRSVASENLTKPNVLAEIDRRLKPYILSANRVLAGLSAIAEIDVAEVFEPDGSFNLAEAKKRGVSRFIKSISYDKDGHVSKVELYSAHEALRDMGKFRKLFTDKIEISDPRKAAADAYAQILSEFPEIDPERVKLIVANDFGVEPSELGTIG